MIAPSFTIKIIPFDDLKGIFIIKRTSSGIEKSIKEPLNDNKLFC